MRARACVCVVGLPSPACVCAGRPVLGRAARQPACSIKVICGKRGLRISKCPNRGDRGGAALSGLSGSGRKEGGVTTKAHSSLLGGKAGTTPLSRSWVMRRKAAELRQKLQALSTETPGLALVERLPRGKQLDWCLFMWILPNFFTVQCEKIGSISVPHCCAYFVHAMQVQLYIVGEANKIVGPTPHSCKCRPRFPKRSQKWRARGPSALAAC